MDLPVKWKKFTSFFVVIGVIICDFPFASSQSNAEKVCRGTDYGLGHSGNTEHIYKTYRAIYTNCTYVDGNLELVFLDNSSLDLSFLSKIREITGYLLVASVFVERLPLTSLRIIRGRTLFEDHHRMYSMFVVKNYDANSPKTVGLRELQLNSLHEISKGNVLFSDNPRLCFLSTINWNDIILSPFNVNVSNTGTEQICKMCSSPGVECDPACHSDFDNARHCWGAGPSMCQTYTKLICPAQCEGRCTGVLIRDCCHIDCAAGCTGPTRSDCLACKHFEDSGRCTTSCPPETLYSEKDFTSIPNPDFKYMYGTLCVKKCPDHLIAQRGACVRECGPGLTPGTGSNLQKCIDCDGPCPKQCSGTGAESVNSRNVRNFTGCTIIQGSIRILNNALLGDPYSKIPPMDVSELSVFETVHEVTDYVQIHLKDDSFVNLAFLKNLRTIKGLKLTTTSSNSLEIFDTSLKSLELISLKTIHGGGVVVANNSNLCYDRVDWRSLVSSQAQRVVVKNNRNPSLCERENEVCSEQCTSQGCWGKREDQCLSCQNFDLEGRCLASCDAEPNVYQLGLNRTCKRCHVECKSGCHGSSESSACKDCQNVRDGPYCVPMCPLTKYADDEGVCQLCHEYCGDSGCTGPQNGVGPQACKSCPIAVFDDNGNNVTTCLAPNSKCEEGYYKRILVNPAIKELDGMAGCLKCHPLCQTCDEYGLSYCKTCKHYRQDDKCVHMCSSDYYLSVADNVCKHCDPRCLGCTGPTASECLLCKTYAIYHNYGLADQENIPFNCTEKCPNEAQYTHIEEREDGSKLTVCIADDGGLKNTRIGIGVGVFVGVVLIGAVVAIIYFYCRRKQAFAETEKMKTAARILGVEPEALPLQPSGVEPDRAMLRLTKESELVKGGMIGAGAFGTVYKGWWVPENENVKIPVAIKVLMETTSTPQNCEMIEEARIMASVNHKYCVRILAICMTARMMIITQLMPFGCLRNYVTQYRNNIGSKALLNWCTQIAKGMEYLESKNIIHRDLAARNILVQRPEHVRITDFGLAKLLNNKQENFTSAGEKMPIKWLALESIQNQTYTSKSDVWSYGVMLWELFTYGETPYTSVPVKLIPGLLEKGERLPQPTICTIDVFMIMIKCWMLDAASRPTFKELANEFEKMAKDPGRYLVIDGDDLLRLPSYNPESETRDFLRMLSFQSEEGSERILTADEYLMPQSNLPEPTVQETSFLSAEPSSALGSSPSQASPSRDQCNRRSRRSLNFFRRSNGSDNRTSQRYILEPCKQTLVPNQSERSRQPSAVFSSATLVAPVVTIPHIDPLARQASVHNDPVHQTSPVGHSDDDSTNVWVVNNNFTPVSSPGRRGQLSSKSSSVGGSAVIAIDNNAEYLQPRAHYQQPQPPYLDVVTGDHTPPEFSDEGIDSESEHAPVEYVDMAGGGGVVSNPEYFDDDAFDVGSPLMQSGNGVMPSSRITSPSILRTGDRLGSGGSKDYYNGVDDLDSAFDGTTASQSLTSRDRLSSRV